MDVTLIGVDCATDPGKVGLALGIWQDHRAQIVEARLGDRAKPLAQTIAGWIPVGRPTLIAMDAPLGWPAKMGQALLSHTAGDPIEVCRDDLFRRTTDRVVQRRLGRRPLDVGADRIARTAHAALQLLQELRAIAEHPIPLAWDRRAKSISAIEVYPAATLTAYDIQASGSLADLSSLGIVIS